MYPTELSPFIVKNEIINSIGITAISCMIKIPSTLLPWGLVISFVSLKVFKTIAVEDKDKAAPMIMEVCNPIPKTKYEIVNTNKVVTSICKLPVKNTSLFIFFK
ncbi:MAG: Uncharacterised protein [Arcobacter lacus]|nr:MAG: Uncharacterised protein [Arcobacter lacus]